MDFDAPGYVEYLATCFGFVSGIWFLFSLAENALREDIRRDIADWLGNRINQNALSEWPGYFAFVFDALFGEHHFTLKCFIRSTVASLSAIALVFLTLLTLRTDTVLSLLQTDAPLTTTAFRISFFLGLNVVVDYISLLETRYAIRLMSNRMVLVQLCIVLIDLVLSFLIYTLTYSVVVAIIEDDVSGFSTFIIFPFLLLLSVLGIIQSDPSTSISYLLVPITFFSTFFTSIWTWLFSASSFSVKSISWVGRFLDLKNKPLRSLSFVCALGVTLLFVLLAFL